MRKLLLTLAVLCGTVSAWAQNVVTSIDVNQVYTLNCKATDHGAFISDDGNVINGRSATGTFFCFEDAGENQYYIKSVKTGKYINHDGSNISASTEKKTTWTINAPGFHSNTVVTFTIGNNKYLNNNGSDCSDGTCTGLKANTHSGGPGEGNACSLWVLTEYPSDPTPELTTDLNNPKYYTIKNLRKGKYAAYAGDAASMIQQTTVTPEAFFYFTGSKADGVATVKIHNYSAGDKLCEEPNSWTEAGRDWYIESEGLGVSISNNADKSGNGTSWNDYEESGTSVGYWNGTDEGSVWILTPVTDFSSVIDVDAAKDASKAELDLLATVPVIYPDVTSAKNSIDAVTPEENTISGLQAAVDKINKIVTDYKASAYQALAGKTFTIMTPARTNNGYMEMSTSSVVGVASATSPADIWQFVYNNGTVKVYNPYTDKYLAEPGGNSAKIGTTDAANAGSYHLNVTGNPADAEAKVKLTSNSKSVHMDGSSNLVRWDNGGASEWKIEEITDFSSIITTYKANAVATLDEWAQLSVVFDAETIKTAKTNLDAITTTDWATFASIDAELDVVLDQIETKYFTFQTKATDANRNGVYVGVPYGQNNARGTDGAHLNAIWQLEASNGGTFYLRNKVTGKYMGNPGGNAALSDSPSDSYSFETVDNTNSIVELKCNGQTLHASNHDDDKLLDYDHDEDASRWIIASVVLSAEQINALVELNDVYTSKGFGTEIGLYTKNDDAIAVEELLAKTLADLETVTVDDINAKKDGVVAHTTINAPAIGKFYRLKNVVSGNYMSSTDTDAVVMLTEGASAASTIFYLDEENKLLSYNKGLFLDCGNKKTAAVGTSYAGEFAVAHGGAVAGVVTYRNNGYWTFGNRGDGVSIDRGQNTPNQAGYNWTLEEVEWLPVPVNTEVGYATIYSPVELALSYDRFKAYTATINEAGTAITLTEQSVVPANTGVVLEYQEGATIENGYVFLQIKETTMTDVKSELRGTFADSYVADDAYILAKPDSYEAGFYKAKKNYENGTKFLNNGFKAYLPKPASSEARFYVFDFGTETGIEGIESENAKAEIYDLSGRRVQNAQKGLYIVNGKKVIK